MGADGDLGAHSSAWNGIVTRFELSGIIFGEGWKRGRRGKCVTMWAPVVWNEEGGKTAIKTIPNPKITRIFIGKRIFGL